MSPGFGHQGSVRITPLVVLALALAALAPLTAAAQCEPEPEPPDHLRAVARQSYTEGVEAAAQERWMEAREAFQRAFDVAPFAQIVYNLATAQAQTDRLVQAAENYRRFLRRCQSEQMPELRADAQQLLTTVAPRIGRLTLRVNNFESAFDRLTLDGEAMQGAILGTEIPINPGQHEVRVVRRGEELESRSFTVGEGESAQVELSVEEYVGPSPEELAEGGGGGTTQPSGPDVGLIVGISIGVALALGAAATVLAIVLTQDSGEQLPEGTWAPAQVPLVSW